MAKKRLKFNKDLCIGCQLCMQACSAMHEEEISLKKARIEIECYYKNKEIVIENHICILCGKCARECPFSAITLEEHIVVDKETCTGCGVCAEVCPTKVVTIRDNKSVICDTCQGDPICVKTCPHSALTFK